MKLIIVACALVAIAVAAPVEKEPAQVVVSEIKQQAEGPYSLLFESNDGIKREETGELKEALNEDNEPQKVVVVRGSYSFVDPDGLTQVITFYADETGYHAEGPGIPVAPVARR